MGRFCVELPIIGSLYQEEELVHVLSTCVAEWGVSSCMAATVG